MQALRPADLVRDVLEPGDDYAIGQVGDRGIDLRPVPAVVADRNRDISDAPLSALSPFGFTDQTPNSSEAAVLPSGYVTMQLNDRIWSGLSFNSPFGLSTNFENPGWAGAFYAQSSSLRTYNGAPTVAIKITDWLSVGGGIQIQYAEPHLLFATGATAPGTPTLGPAHRPWLDGRLDRRRNSNADAVDPDRPRVSLRTQSIDRWKFRAGSAGSTAVTTVRWPDSASWACVRA